MTEVDRVTLELRMDATITIRDGAGEITDWLKPGTSASTSFRGGIPTDQETELAYRWLQKQCATQLEEVIVSSKKRLDQQRRGG